MLRRWLQSWCWGVVLLTMLGPAVTLACRRAEPTPWKVTSKNGRFELSLEIPRSYLSPPFPLTLRDARTQKVIWRSKLERFAYAGDLVLSPSGQYLALADSYSPEIILFGPDGTERRWSLEEHLKKSEIRRLSYSTCGREWIDDRHFEGEVLVLNVLTGGVVPPIYKQPKGTVVRIDARTGQLTREAPPPGESTAKLIQDFKSASDESQREDLARELVERSADAGIGGDATLSRLWLDVLTAPQPPPSIDTLAVEGLSLVGTDAELRQVSRLPQGSQDRNHHLHRVLEQRLPDEAEAYSLRILSERWQPELLRAIALNFLTHRERTVAARGIALALEDPSGKVRDSALYGLTNQPLSAAAIEKVLSFCKDPDADVRGRAVESLHRMLDDVGEKEERLAIYELLGRADADGRLKCYPEGWVILGAVADAQGDRAQALKLYDRGLKALKALAADRRNISRDLVMEATLQLAFEAQKQGKSAEVKRWAREVLADERNQSEFVCAPRTSAYGGPANVTGCRGRSTAGYTAQALLEETKARGKK